MSRVRSSHHDRRHHQHQRENPLEIVHSLTDGLGADVAIEAVGVSATFEVATTLIRPCGHIANIGVHGKPVTLHLEDLWPRNVSMTTGLVDAYSTPTLLRLVANDDLDPAQLVTHDVSLDDVDDAYDVFERAGDTGALKSSSPPELTAGRAQMGPVQALPHRAKTEWPVPVWRPPTHWNRANRHVTDGCGQDTAPIAR